MRVIFTGAQGTGKTTILNYYKDKGYNVITEIVRNLHKDGVKINQEGDDDTQWQVFNIYKELLSGDEYISDRGLVDVLAYSKEGRDRGVVSDELVKEQLKELRVFTAHNPDILYIYFPIYFVVSGDGVRSVDEEYRKKIDEYIKENMREANIKFLIAPNLTPDEKFEAIDWMIQHISA